MHPLGSREVGEQTYSSLGFTLGRGGGSCSPKCLNLGGKSKEKETMSFSACKKEIIVSQQDLEAPAGGRERNRRNE